MHRSALILTFGGGTNEVQRDIIAAAGLGLPLSRRDGRTSMDFASARAQARARRAGPEDPGRAGHAGAAGGRRAGPTGSTPRCGPTWPRPACWPPRCRSRWAARARLPRAVLGADRAGPGAVAPVPYLASVVLGAGALARVRARRSSSARWARPAGAASWSLTAALAEEDGDDPAAPSTRAERGHGRRGWRAVRGEDRGAGRAGGRRCSWCRRPPRTGSRCSWSRRGRRGHAWSRSG